MSAVSQATERFSFRLDAEKKQAIERAAAARGLTLTDFAIMILYREAQEVLKDEQTVVLSDRDRDAFLAALENPPRENERALRAARKYKDARSKGEIVS